MGFWHTGYMEHHESALWERVDRGLSRDPLPLLYPCSDCQEMFSSASDLRHHRFEEHRLRRPVLLVGDREIGRTRVTIARPLDESDVHVDGAEEAWLNGHKISPSTVPEKLARARSGVVKLSLRSSGLTASFELDFRLASEDDLQGVEREFSRMARRRHLDIASVEEFITAARRFQTAIGYCDGICAYLYGVLAKERAADSSLPYESYGEKFSRAAEELAPYDRPLSRTIGGLIAFHFNHYRDAVRLSPGSRLGIAAERFLSWTAPQRESAVVPPALPRSPDFEELLTDLDTERIVRWSTRPLSDLCRSADEIEEMLRSSLTSFDRVKIHILLAEIHADRGSTADAARHVIAIRNVPEFEIWAEARILTLSGAGDGRF